MQIRIDDDTIFGGEATFIQFPSLDVPFPSYAKYDRNGPDNGELSFTLRNSGPEGIWIMASGTRAIFSNLNDTLGWAGMLKSHNATGFTSPSPETDFAYYPGWEFLDVRSDSLFISSDSMIELTFWPPQTKPQETAGTDATKVPVGSYELAINIIGYDTAGANLFKKFNVGLVRVTDTG